MSETHGDPDQPSWETRPYGPPPKSRVPDRVKLKRSPCAGTERLLLEHRPAPVGNGTGPPAHPKKEIPHFKPSKCSGTLQSNAVPRDSCESKNPVCSKDFCSLDSRFRGRGNIGPSLEKLEQFFIRRKCSPRFFWIGAKAGLDTSGC